MRRVVYLVLSALCVILLVSCTSPVKKDIFINISLTGEAANINHSKFSTSPANFQDNIVVNKYKVYLYQNGKVVYQEEFSNLSNNTISLHLTNINSGTYTLRLEVFNDTTPIFYGEEVVQLSYGQNNTQLTTYFNKARLTVNVQNQAEGFELTGLSIEGSLPASPTNNFVENAPFQNKEIYPGVWHIDLEATMTSDSSSIKVIYPPNVYEIYPSEDKVVNFVVNNIPQVRIVNPTDGETLHGTVTILAEAQDNEGIAQVEFSANDKFLKDFISSPYEYAWNTYGVIDGTYTLKAKATNLSGNQNSESINVIVNNGQKTFGGSGNDYARSVKQTTDGGYIVAGSTASFGAGGYDVYILKLDSNENLVWQKTFGGGLDDRAYSIQQTTDGGYIVAGETYSSGADGCDICVLKLNSDGEMVWQQTFGGNGDDAALSIQQTADDGYIVAGYTSVLLADGFDVSNAYILKLGSSGNPAWQKVLGGEYSSYAYSAQQTTDGGYIVGGATTSFAGDGDVYVLKLNSDGEMVWQKTFGESGDDAAYSIQQTTDSGYIVAGHTNSFGAGSYDVYILKLNSSGELQQ